MFSNEFTSFDIEVLLIITVFSIFINKVVSASIMNKHGLIKDYNEEKEDEPKMKKCKYCMSEIDSNATVCKVCKRNQSNANNPILLIPILIIIGLTLFFLYSPNAPFSIRKPLCELGIRKGLPYCATGEYEFRIETKTEK